MCEKGNKVAYFDVMLGGKFLFQISYEYFPLFKINIEDVMNKVYARRPSLKGKSIRLCLTENAVK